MAALLHIEGLNARWPFRPLWHIDALTLDAGDWHLVSGPSGQGKSTLLQCVLGLPPQGLHLAGRLSGGLLRSPDAVGGQAHRRLIGPIAYLHQHPQQVFPGHRRVGAVTAEAVKHHLRLPRAEAKARLRLQLTRLQLPADTLERFPHQLSGGQLQRAQLAMVLAWEPRVLLLDEPVAALDEDTTALVLDVLQDWLKQDARAILHVTHRPELMGRRPHTPWVLHQDGLRPSSAFPTHTDAAIAEVTLPGGWQIEGLCAAPPGSAGVSLLHDVDIRLPPSTTVAITGLSGAGKTTLAHALAWLPRPTRGRFLHCGDPVESEAHWHRLVTFVPQDPTSAFAPHLTVGEQLADICAARLPGVTPAQLVHRVDMQPELLDHRPAELSGGQLQRFTLLRALCSGARLWILDEPTSALDPARKSQLAELLRQLQATAGITLVLLTHDLPFAARLAHRWMTLDAGRLTVCGPPVVTP